MRTITRSALAIFVLVVAACGGGKETTEEPKTPATAPETAKPSTGTTAEPLTPAAGEGATKGGTETPSTTEAPTPKAPPPLALKVGDASSEITHVVLLRDPAKKGKDKVLFFSSSVTCDEVTSAKGKPLSSEVLATDVKAEGTSHTLAQPMKITYYKDGKPTPINAKKEDVTFDLSEGSGGKLSGNLKIKSKVGKSELSVDGPFEATLCEVPAPAAPAPKGGAAGGTKAPKPTPEKK